MKQYGAEFFGTFWLVLGGCGSAVLAAGVPELGIGYLGVALAFGLSVLTMACHRPDLRRPPEPRGIGRPVGRRALPGQPTAALSSPRSSVASPPAACCT